MEKEAYEEAEEEEEEDEVQVQVVTCASESEENLCHLKCDSICACNKILFQSTLIVNISEGRFTMRAKWRKKRMRRLKRKRRKMRSRSK